MRIHSLMAPVLVRDTYTGVLIWKQHALYIHFSPFVEHKLGVYRSQRFYTSPFLQSSIVSGDFLKKYSYL